MNNLEFNFIHKSRTQEDKESFFGPLEPTDGPFIVFDDTWTMADIVTTAGIFPSKTQARKNGFDKPIPVGWTQLVMTKRKIKIFILNFFPHSKCDLNCTDEQIEEWLSENTTIDFETWWNAKYDQSE